MTDFAEAVSLALSFPTIVVGLGVLAHWWRDAWESWKTPAIKRTAVNWLILGVTIGFLGGVLDNLYWFLAWSAEFIHHPSKNLLFEYGAWPNIPFRQCSGIYAAYCHLRSYYSAREENKNQLKLIVLGSFTAGALYILLVSFIR